MRTFLPYPNFDRSLRALDYKRLGQMRTTVLHLLQNPAQNHPIYLMWYKHEHALARYGYLASRLFGKRYIDTVARSILTECHKRNLPDPRQNPKEYPWWFGVEAVHESHQAVLVYEDPGLYYHKFPNVTPPPQDGYEQPPLVWPLPYQPELDIDKNMWGKLTMDHLNHPREYLGEVNVVSPSPQSVHNPNQEGPILFGTRDERNNNKLVSFLIPSAGMVQDAV